MRRDKKGLVAVLDACFACEFLRMSLLIRASESACYCGKWSQSGSYRKMAQTGQFAVLRRKINVFGNGAIGAIW
ncbi:MAG: hypothetical protein IPK59_01960 [Rhodospirillaceae bacterium]|nr:hypothetical protein [Rhodospirillaceae bacterium]